jgi:crotonobetainyl-CoA:carnitine CoA-transferase CaiB-like acyl-CoA transferase
MSEGDKAALAGVRVLDLGHGIAGPFAARLLGDFGAEVFKFERPGDGDFVRRMPPFFEDAGSGERVSGLFEYLNWNKEAVAADLATENGRDRVLAAVAEADVVVTSFRPGRLEEWGIGIDRLRELNPALVVLAVTNFGYEGPNSAWEGTDLIFQATGGVMQISGTVDNEPLKPGLRQSLYCAGLNGAYGAMAALYGARRNGQGTFIDLSIQEVVASQMVMNQPLYSFCGAVQGRRPPTEDPLGGKPLPAADGFVSIQTNTFTPLDRFAELLDDDRLRDSDFASTGGRLRHADRLNAILDEHLRNESARGFFERACQEGLLVGFVQTAADQLSCPQLEARHAFHASPDLRGESGPVRFPSVVATLSATPSSVRRRAPRPDEDAALPPRGNTFGAGARAATEDPGDPAAGPLAGLRVIDLSTVFAVPYIGGLLSDLGAEVIKVEPPKRLDQTRSGFGLQLDNLERTDYWNYATTFPVLNRGKRSIALDLSTEAGRKVLVALVEEADILLDNFTPRVMKKWGTTYDSLSAVNPRLIMLSNTGFGSTGPWSSFKAQGTTLEATMGMTSYTGYRGGPPAKAGQSYPDFLSCWSGLCGIMAALLSRQATGRGQWIDLGMYQLGPVVIPEALLRAQADGVDLGRIGNADLDTFFSGLLPAAGEDSWLAVSIADRGDAAKLGAVVTGLASVPPDAPDLADRVASELGEWAAGREAQEAAAALQAVGVAAGAVMDSRDLLLDRHLAERGLYERVDFGPDLGTRQLIGRPYRWHSDGSRLSVRGPGPAYADSNGYVLREVAGLPESAIEELYEAGIVVDEPVDPPPPQPWDLELMLKAKALTMVDPDYRDIEAAASATE